MKTKAKVGKIVVAPKATAAKKEIPKAAAPVIKKEEKKPEVAVRKDGTKTSPTSITCKKCKGAMLFCRAADGKAWRECTKCGDKLLSPKYFKGTVEKKAPVKKEVPAEKTAPILKKGTPPKTKKELGELVSEVVDEFAGRKVQMGVVAKALIARGIANTKENIAMIRAKLLDAKTEFIEIKA